MAENVSAVNMATVEFYEAEFSDKLLGAMYLPAKRLFESADTLGKTVCKLLHLNSVAVIYYNQDGSIAARDVIFR